MQEWLTQSAVELGRGIGRGEIDPVALTETYLTAIAEHAFTDRIYARLTVERASAEAAAAAERARLGVRRSVLDGVPISWKDLFDTAGVATESGSRLLEGRVPQADALVLQRATAAGLVCLGKTHQTELAFSGLGLNPMTATPPNVNDHGAAPGGSSSGAAASVAFGLAAAGIGSDTGGSVRVPSVWNDLVGFKTAHGALSLEGVVPLCARFDTVGPLARSVEDAAVLNAIMGGTAAPDLRAVSLAGKRFLSLQTLAHDDIEDGPAQGYARSVEALRGAGAEVIEGDLPLVAEANALSPILFAAEAYGTWKDAIEAAPEKMYGPICDRFRGGKDVSAPDWVAGWQALDRFRAAYRAATAGYDAVLVPTCPILPPNVARLETDEAYFVRANLMTLRNTRIGNLMGLAVVTLPTGVPSTGLSIMVPPGREGALLRLSAAAEAALG